MIVEAQMKRLKETFGSGESLCDELTPYVREGHLRHKFIVLPFYTYHFARIANQQYEAKKQRAEEANKKKKWSEYIFIHERPFRLEAFMEISHRLTYRQYWKLLAEVWTDCEFPNVNLGVWRTLWTRKISADDNYPGNRLPRKDEVVFCALWTKAHLHGHVELWRGGRSPKAMRGLSWTTSREKAAWFARRDFGSDSGRPYLWRAKVPPQRLLAYLSARREHEVIVDCNRLNSKLITLEPLAP